MSRPSRRLAIAAISAAALAPRTTTAQPALFALRIGTQAIDTSALVFYAQKQGFFRQNGLDAAVDTVTRNGAEIGAAIAGGSLDIGHSNLVTIAQIHEKKLPMFVVSVGGSHRTSAPTTGLLVKKDSPIQTGRDLNGKTVATNGIGNITQVGISAWIDRNGGDYRSVKWLELNFSAMPAALATGRVDATIAPEPVLTEALDGGAVRNLGWPYEGIGPKWQLSASIADGAWVAAHPDIVRKFDLAMDQAARWANAHHGETAKMLEELSKQTVAPNTHRVFYSERLDPADIQPVIDASAKYGALAAAFPATELIAPILLAK